MSANQRSVWQSIFIVIAMFGFGYALVPLYDVFCDITGLNGKTANTQIDSRQLAELQSDVERLVTVEFVANINSGLPWEFRPVVRQLEVHPGELYHIDYRAVNHALSPVSGQAVPSVSPGQAANYFSKTECFCFTQQTLQAGEEVLMPVRFVVDPLLPANVSTVTLSYTFFQTPS